MKTYGELIKNLKDNLNSLLTADNTELITQAVSELDELSKLGDDKDKEILGLKDRIVDIVKNTSFAENPKSEEKHLVEEPKDIDKAFEDGIAKIQENRRKK